MAAKLEIRVGASVDRSVATVFKTIVDAAKRAREQIERELNNIHVNVGGSVGAGAGGGKGGPYRSIVLAAEQANTAIVAAAEKRERELAAIAARAERAERGRSERGQRERRNADVDSFARRTSYRTIHHVNNAVRGGIGLAGDMARAAGVDFSLGSMVGRAVSQEAAAVALSNQGYMPGAAGPNGQVQRSGDILAGARQTGQAFARDTNEVLEATSAFVGLTGDLAQARAIMGDLAKLSNATGSGLVDMASAAANVSTALDQGFSGTTEEKVSAMNAVMRSIAGQGKVGAVEIKDLAAQMAKLAAASGQFAGKREDLLGLVGVLAQESRKAGGSASATQAATSILSFATNLSKPSKAQQKVMAQYGLDPYADKGKTQLLNPEEFIKQAIGKTGGNLQALGGIFSTSGSMRAVRGFANVYNQAGGGEKGMAAVEAEFQALKKASLDRAEVERANAAALETSKAKAIQFQNNLEMVASSMATKVLPQLEQIAPTALKVVDSLGRIIGWAAENPWTAVAAALAASIARAGIESTIRFGIDTAIKSAAKGLAGMEYGGVNGGKGLANGLAKIGGVVAVSIVAWEAGTLLIDWFADKKSKAQNEAEGRDLENENALGAARAEQRKSGTVSADTRKQLYDAFVRLGSSVEAKRLAGSTNEVDKMNLAHQEATLEAMRALLAQIANGIPVTNLPGGGGLGVPGMGRTGPETFGPGGNGWGQGMFL